MGACCGRKKQPEGEQADGQGGGQTAEPFPGSSIPQPSDAAKRSKKELYNKTSAVHDVLDMKDFDEQLQLAGDKLVVVDFYAVWCGPCKVVGPKIDILAKEMTDIMFLKVDVDDCEELAIRQNITRMPTFMYFKSGQMVEEEAGADVEKVKELILANK